MTTEYNGNSELLEGVSPSKEDLFFLEWGKETLKENITTLNETFKLFITLDTVLLSTYLGFYQDVLQNYPPLSWQAIFPALSVIVSLVAAIIGIYPFPKSVSLASPQEIKRYKENRLEFKSYCLAVVSITLVLGFIVFLLARVTLPVLDPAILPMSTPVP